MAGTELFEQLGFVENPLYEKIINDLMEQQYSIVENFFNPDEVDSLRKSLLDKYEEDKFKKSAIGNHTNEHIVKEVRGDFILWIDENSANTVEKAFFSKVNDLILYLNRTCFMGILQKEFHYAVYPRGTFYKRHLDTFQLDDRRKLSFVCYLNDQDWKTENGGELVLYFNDEMVETEKAVYPVPGRVVIFESSVIEHEVRPVLDSERLSITGWLKTR